MISVYLIPWVLHQRARLNCWQRKKIITVIIINTHLKLKKNWSRYCKTKYQIFKGKSLPKFIKVQWNFQNNFKWFFINSSIQTKYWQASLGLSLLLLQGPFVGRKFFKKIMQFSPKIQFFFPFFSAKIPCYFSPNLRKTLFPLL